MKLTPTKLLLASLLALGVAGIITSPAKAASSPATTSSQVDPAALQRWRAARFGMFITWGPVTQTGYEISWTRGLKIPIEKYDNLYKTFDPEKFNADTWVSVAKAAGMKYIVLVCKHHDGFCLWPTRQTDYNIMNTPFKHDIVGELAEACKKQGIAFGCYYSTTDWHNPDFPLTSPGGTVKRPQSNLDKYTEYLKAQVRELLVNYGPLFTLWFDEPQDFNHVRGQSVIDMARSIQPSIIIDNRTGAPGDYDTPEQYVGKFNRERPWETCLPIEPQWAWKPDGLLKPYKQDLQTLIRCSGNDGNFLFNLSPEPNGEIAPDQVAVVKQMGDWLAKYGESIYGTRGGPYKPGTWDGVSTCKGNDIYLHILSWTGDTLRFPPFGRKIIKSELLTGGQVNVTQDAGGVTVSVSPADRQDPDTIVKLELDGPAFDIPPMAVPSGSIALGKSATASSFYKNRPDWGAEKAFDDDTTTCWRAGDKTVPAWLAVDLGQPATITSVELREGRAISTKYPYVIQGFELQYLNGHDQWKTFYTGTTIGDCLKVSSFTPFTARQVRLNVLKVFNNTPKIAEFHLFSKP